MMKLKLLAVAVIVTGVATSAFAQHVFRARLIGVGETPIVVSGALGHATLTISDDEKSIKYELTYGGLEGNTVPSGKVLFAHVHVGAPTVVGGVAVFFCGGGNTSATQAACPISGAVSGMWTSLDVVGPTSQGLDPANQGSDEAFARLVKAIKSGLSYANVHTTRSPGGEVRGQFMRARERGDR